MPPVWESSWETGNGAMLSAQGSFFGGKVTKRGNQSLPNTQLAPNSLSPPLSWVSSFLLSNSSKEPLSALPSHQICRQGTREARIILQNLEQKIKAATSARAGGAISIILQMKGSPLPPFRNKVGWDERAGTRPCHPSTPSSKYMEMRVGYSTFLYLHHRFHSQLQFQTSRQKSLDFCTHGKLDLFEEY